MTLYLPRAAKKSHKKLTRAFSFSRTPRRVVQRAVSTMASPAHGIGGDQITPGLGTTPSRTVPMSTSHLDSPDHDNDPISSGLTPGMSVNCLDTPQLGRRANRLSSSSSSMQVHNHTLPSYCAINFDDDLDEP